MMIISFYRSLSSGSFFQSDLVRMSAEKWRVSSSLPGAGHVDYCNYLAAVDGYTHLSHTYQVTRQVRCHLTPRTSSAGSNVHRPAVTAKGAEHCMRPVISVHFTASLLQLQFACGALWIQ